MSGPIDDEFRREAYLRRVRFTMKLRDEMQSGSVSRLMTKLGRDPNNAMRAACIVGSMVLVTNLLDRFSHGQIDIGQAFPYACEGGNIYIIHSLIGMGVNNPWNQGFMGACTAENREVMFMMIRRGATECRCGKPLSEHLDRGAGGDSNNSDDDGRATNRDPADDPDDDPDAPDTKAG